jgi:hypothetical protein
MRIPTRNLAVLCTVLVATACGGGEQSQEAAPPPSGPAIGNIAPVTVNQDTTAMVPIPVTDGQSPISSLVYTATAMNSTLVLPQGLVVQMNNGVPTLYVTPAESATGVTQITVAVSDPKGGTAQQTFMLTVNAVDVSFTTFAEEVLAAAETAPPVTVNGLTFIQDADDSTIFDALFD